MNHRRLIAAALLIGAAVPASAQTVKAGISAWQHADYESAVRIWRPLAEKGDPDAEFNLAQAYRLGRGVPVNLAAAQTWLQRAANQGHVDAETTLGLLLFQNGDRTLGVFWLKAAAARNDPRAMLVYGTALFNGDGVKENAALGYAYVSRAAAQGLAPAKDTLAQMEQTLPPEQRTKGAELLADARPQPKTPTSKAHPAKAVPPKPEPKPASPPAKPELAAAPGGWRVQLGAFSERKSAETLFRKLSGSSALSGRTPAYVAAGPVIRLQVGPFESRQAAAAACRALAARSQACFPVAAR